MYSLDLARTPADLYDLGKDDLLQLEGWKERSAERFLNSLKDSRKVGFEHVLFAIGIRYVGETTAKSVARYFGNIDRIASATKEELLAVPDIGDVIADSIFNYFRDERHLIEIQRLKAAGLKFSIDEPAENLSAALAGKTIVISGNFSISRDEMKALIEKNGGKNSSSLCSKTTYLLAGTKPGPEKMKKAAEIGIEVIDEETFMRMLPGHVETTVQTADGSVSDQDNAAEADFPADLFGGMI